MNALPGVFGEEQAKWTPQAIPPVVHSGASAPQLTAGHNPAVGALDAGPTVSAAPVADTLQRAVGTVMLHDRPFAEIISAREKQVAILDAGGDVVWWLVVGVLCAAIVGLVWVLIVRLWSQPSYKEDE